MNEKRANKNKYLAGHQYDEWSELLAQFNSLATLAQRIGNVQLYAEIKKRCATIMTNKHSKKVYKSLMRDIEKYTQLLRNPSNRQR